MTLSCPSKHAYLVLYYCCFVSRVLSVVLSAILGQASGATAWVGGGEFNTATGTSSGIAAGENNIATAFAAIVAGGFQNTVLFFVLNLE